MQTPNEVEVSPGFDDAVDKDAPTIIERLSAATSDYETLGRECMAGMGL